MKLMSRYKTTKSRYDPNIRTNNTMSYVPKHCIYKKINEMNRALGHLCAHIG